MKSLAKYVRYNARQFLQGTRKSQTRHHDGRAPKAVLAVTSDMSASVFYRGYLGFLRRRGWDVTIVANDEGRLSTLAASEGVKSHSIPMQRKPSVFSDVHCLVLMCRLFARETPDIVVAGTPKASLLAMTAGWLSRVPARVYQLWGLRLETVSGPARLFLYVLESVTARFSTQVVANSQSLAAKALSLKANGGKIPVVLGDGSSHGVDLNHFSPVAESPSLDPATDDFLSRRSTLPLVGYIGRIHPDKGVDTLLEALAICRKSDLALRSLLVGPLEDGSKGRLKEDCYEPSMIHCTGDVSDVRPYLKVIDVLCLPTLREGFPNVVLEAAAYGIPTITTDATGAIDSVVNGVTGYIVPVHGSEAMADRLRLLQNDASLRSEMGEAAKRWVEEKFDCHRIWAVQESNMRQQVGNSESLTSDSGE